MLKRKKMMESFGDKQLCPRCGGAHLRTWDELADEEKFLVERLPSSAEYTRAERKKHRFCPRCWFEENNVMPRQA